VRFRLANPGSENYLCTEAFLNNLLLVPINSGTELVLGVAQVDQNGNPTSGQAATASINSVAAAASNTVLIAANPTRKGLIIFNNSTSILYVALTEAASTSNFTYRLTPYATLELIGDKNFLGNVQGFWASATGDALVTELSE